jgi:excisionase family DNA binding protein
MGRRTALELSPITRGTEKTSFGELLTAVVGDAPQGSGDRLGRSSDSSWGDEDFEAEIGKVSTGNRDQIAVLSSQPAVIGRLFLTVEEAAQRLGVTAGWIYERTRRKAIPHRKLGKFVRFTEEDLRAIVEGAAKGTMQ